MRTENKKKRKTRQCAVFFHAEKRVIFARIAFICVYGHIMRVNMHIYAKYIIKSFVKRLTHTRTHAIINIY